MPFCELIGQTAAVTALLRAKARDRLAHALLFTGPEGVGKRTAALALAQALNCAAPREDGDACGVCSSCRRIASGSHPDVRVIEPEAKASADEREREAPRTDSDPKAAEGKGKTLKVGQVRERVLQDAYLKPMEGRAKVYILDPAEALNVEAENSLLKMLEEPPKAVTLVLASSQPFYLLPTIRSRCREVRFSPLAPEVLAPWLQARLACAPEEAQTLARLSGGRPGEALRQAEEDQREFRREVLDQLRPGAGTDRAGRMFSTKEQAADLPDALALLLTWYRDLLLLSLGGAPELLINVDRRDELAAIAARSAPEAWERSCGLLLQAMDQLHRNANAQLLLDVLWMKLEPGAA